MYVTGRSIRGGPTTDNVPGTIDDTAAEVTARGGPGIAVRCDHTSDADVDALFARIRDDHGRLDLLVNNVWGGYEHHECRPLTIAPFWEQSLQQWDRMFTAGVRAHLTASRLAAPLMVPQRRGLIVSTTANLRALPYLPNLFYDLAKNAVSHLVWAMAQELREHNVAAVAVAPGFMRTERVVEAFTRAGAAHALDGPEDRRRRRSTWDGRSWRWPRIRACSTSPASSGSRRARAGCGFTDLDGAQPPPFRLGSPA